MKFLLILLVIVVVVWIARGGSRGATTSADGTKGSPRRTREEMVACAQCGVHLPASEALPGRGGVFCCEAHRTSYEQAHPRT